MGALKTCNKMRPSLRWQKVLLLMCCPKTSGKMNEMDKKTAEMLGIAFLKIFTRLVLLCQEAEARSAETSSSLLAQIAVL